MSENIIKESTINIGENPEDYRAVVSNIPMIVYLQYKNKKYLCGSLQAKAFLEEGIDKDTDCIVNTYELSMNSSFEDDYVISHQKQIVCEKTAFDQKGKEHKYKILKTPIINKNNDIKGIITIIQNIDIAKQNELQAAMYLSALAHDLKNVVHAVIRSMELFQKGTFGKINIEQNEIVEMMLESMNYLKRLLGTITKTCKENNGVLAVERTWFSLKELIEVCINEMDVTAKQKNVNINFEFSHDDKNLIYADELIIRRVIENILDNTIHHAFDNTCLNVRLKQIGNKIVFSFENQSKEIPEKLQKRIFEKYVSSLKSIDNVGLGLYFCKKAVNAHEGQIYLEANGEINKFVVELPILDENAVLIKQLIL